MTREPSFCFPLRAAVTSVAEQLPSHPVATVAPARPGTHWQLPPSNHICMWSIVVFLRYIRVFPVTFVVKFNEGLTVTPSDVLSINHVGLT